MHKAKPFHPNCNYMLLITIQKYTYLNILYEICILNQLKCIFKAIYVVM